MIRRRALAQVAALAGFAGLGLGAACDSEEAAPGCQLGQQITAPGTPLTLLGNARLDQAGSGLVLMGYDGQLVRWATVQMSLGGLGTEQSVAVPAPEAGPWFGVAGDRAPGDTMVIAYGVAAATPGDVDIMIMTAPIDGSGGAVPAGKLVTVADPSAPGGTLVAMSSSRAGMRAGLAWALPGQPVANVQLLDGDGHPVGAPLAQPISDAAAQIQCLSFVTGRDGLAVGYLTEESPSDPNPLWTVVELQDGGGVDSALGLPLGTESPTCPLTAATAGGYIVGWQNALGSFIGVYDSSTNQFPSSLFVGAVAFGGPDLQPPLVGLGPAGADFAVVMAEPNAAEAWQVEPNGALPGGPLVFPSVEGQIGQVSSVPASGAIYATYADYTSLDANGVGTAGQRFFVKVSCL